MVNTTIMSGWCGHCSAAGCCMARGSESPEAVSADRTGRREQSSATLFIFSYGLHTEPKSFLHKKF